MSYNLNRETIHKKGTKLDMVLKIDFLWSILRRMYITPA
jgi:hypothetical protein